jgi:hypothetical protein
MLIFKVLHILSMFTAVTLLVGEGLFISVAIWRRDVHALAAIIRIAGRRPVVGPLFLLAGIVFGLLTAATGGFDFFNGWLIAAYVLVAALLLFNASPPVEALLKLANAAAEAEAGQRPLDQVAHDISTVRPGRLITVNVVLFATIIADMVLKPF